MAEFVLVSAVRTARRWLASVGHLRLTLKKAARDLTSHPGAYLTVGTREAGSRKPIQTGGGKPFERLNVSSLQNSTCFLNM